MQITAELVKDLIAAQFPQWSGLPVRPVEKKRTRQPHVPPRRCDVRAPAERQGL